MFGSTFKIDDFIVQNQNPSLDMIVFMSSRKPIIKIFVPRETREIEYLGRGDNILAMMETHVLERDLIISIGMNKNSSDLELYIQDTETDTEFFSIANLSITNSAKNKVIAYFSPPPFDTSTLPKVKVPVGQKDIITQIDIEDGMIMADFHKERDERGRYYTKESYDKLGDPKKNPWTRQPIAPDDVQFYIAELDDAMPVVRAGRRRTRRRRLV
jgi:hypothetical protein